jgi:hypothetical protein
MAAAALSGFGLVEAWALWRFGAAEASARNLLLLWLLVPLLLVLSWPLWNGRIDVRMLGLAVVGLVVLAQVALQLAYALGCQLALLHQFKDLLVQPGEFLP